MYTHDGTVVKRAEEEASACGGRGLQQYIVKVVIFFTHPISSSIVTISVRWCLHKQALIIE